MTNPAEVCAGVDPKDKQPTCGSPLCPDLCDCNMGVNGPKPTDPACPPRLRELDAWDQLEGAREVHSREMTQMALRRNEFSEKARAATERAERAEALLAAVGIARMFQGALARKWITDIGNREDVWSKLDKAEARVRVLLDLLNFIATDNTYCIVCGEDWPEYAETDYQYFENCKPDCRLKKALTQGGE